MVRSCIWSVTTGERLVNLIAGRDGEWLSITPAKFFGASRSGTELLSVVQGLRSTTVSQIHQSLCNPDLLREALAGDTSGEV